MDYKCMRLTIIGGAGAMERWFAAFFNFDVAGSRKYMNPMVAILMDFVGRLLQQDPHLSAMIQTNFEIFELVTTGDVEGIIDETKIAMRHFGDTKRAQLDSDKIIEEQINK